MPLSFHAVGMLDLYRLACDVCVFVCLLCGTTLCTGRRTASGAKSRTHHKETTSAGATGADGNSSALF